ncbi:efflux RND transporter permease subunit [Candidatus Sororendozoicomonas aggregata]|uniref:efflux RND transporter permease subunit n=1 Tax=Candidatus Sororendozoicomonas aggregata TaxID=3073239 RepID=UPI002ED21E5F
MNTTRDKSNGIIAWFAANNVAANLMMLLIIAAGLISAWMIKKQTFPDFDVNTVKVEVNYPGAGPTDIEQSIIIKLEEAVRDISGIKKVVSMAYEGRAVVLVDTETGFDVDTLYNDVKSAVESMTSLPEKAERPVIGKIEPEKPVIFVTVSGGIDALSLQRLARQMHQELMALPEVTKATIMGERNLEVAIEVSESSLRRYGLTFDELAERLRLSSVDLAGGAIRTSSGDISVKTRGQADKGVDFSRLVVRTNSDGSRLRLGDIATVHDGFEEDEAIVRLNGEPAVSIQVQSGGNQSDIETVKAIKAYLEKARDDLPGSVKALTWGDVSFYLEGRMDMMLENMLYGALLVFMILSLFLRLKVAFWVVVGIPVCFLGALWLMPHGPVPVSVNVISLFAFILVLGVVVDDAIVIGESVHTQTMRHGHSLENVISGVKRVVVPATFGVLTTMAAFLPVLFVEGQGAPFFESIGVVVILCLIFSLVESKLILPAHLAHMKPVAKTMNPLSQAIHRLQDRFDEKLQTFIVHRYQPLLQKAVNNRYITISVFVGILLITLGLASSPLVRFVFFPKLPSDFIEVELSMNSGSSLAARNAALTRVEQALVRLDEDYQKANPGESLLDVLFLHSSSNTAGKLVAELTKSEERSMDAFSVVNQWRRYVGDIPGVRQLNFSASTDTGGSKPLYFRLSGNDYERLRQAAAALTAKVNSYDGVFDVENTSEAPVDEVTLGIRPEGEALGLTLATLGNQVRQGLYGEEVQRFQRGNEEVKVMLRYPLDERNDLTDLEQVRIRTSDGSEVPFYEVAEITLGEGSSFIRRTNGVRSVAVMAEVDTRRVEPDAIIDDIERNYLPQLFEQYPGVSSGLEGATLEQKKLVQQLSAAGLMALFLIYALIAIPLKSYLQPVMVMVIIPFGLVGAVFGHILFDISFSLLSVYGLIALAGVLVNDSLILVNFINEGRDAGQSLHEAVLSGGKERFRAIILTSLTTFLGLVPITLETSLQAQIVIPMAVSLGFGILFGTVITLFLIPALYLVLDDMGRTIPSLFAGKGQQA